MHESYYLTDDMYVDVPMFSMLISMREREKKIFRSYWNEHWNICNTYIHISKR